MPVENPGLAGGVNEKVSGWKFIIWSIPIVCCGDIPKRVMPSNGEVPLILELSKFSVRGEPQLEMEQLEAEEVYSS